jgi:hypothetical protein
MRPLFLRSIAVALIALSLTSCSKDEARKDAPRVSLGTSARALAENRTVRVTPWRGDRALEAVDLDPRAAGPVAGLEDPLGPAGSPDGRVGVLEALASGCEYIRDGFQRPSIRQSYEEAGVAFSAPECELKRWGQDISSGSSGWDSDPLVPGAYPSLYSYPGVFSGGLRGGIAKCVADQLMQLAEAVQPTYINGGTLAYVGERDAADDADIWFPSPQTTTIGPLYQDILSKLFGVQNEAWPAERVLYTVGVPSSSDAATWALLAVDFYRLATFEATIQLQCPEREEYGWVLDGELLTADTRYSVELSESFDGMERAADLARRKIAAAADQRLAKATDKVSAISENWVAQFNSRLEAARAYLPMPPQMFDGWRVTPLTQVRYESRGDGWSVEAVFLTSDPYRWADFGFPTQSTKCFIHPPDGPEPPGTKPLVTVVAPGAQVMTVAGAVDGLLGLPASVRELVKEFRLEGYLEANTSRGATVPVLSCGTLNSEVAKLVAHCGACPSGETGAVVGYAFPAYPSRAQLPGRFPIVTAVKQAPQEEIAEHLLRTTRVDPRLAASGNARDDIDALIVRVARAYDSDRQGILSKFVSASAVDVEGVLSTFGTTREAFVNAAKRVTQQAQALGRGITPDPDTTGPIPRVLGTEERSDAAEAAYYQALAERSSHLAWLAPLSDDGVPTSRLEIVNESGSDIWHFPLQHAQHGVRHAQASLLSTLGQPGFRLRAGNRLSTEHLELLRARLLNDIEGWASVYVNRGRTPGTVAVALRDLRVQTVNPAATYEVWVGEAGLDCALGKTTCDTSNYRFSNVQFQQEGPGKTVLVLPVAGEGGCRLPSAALRFQQSTSCALRFDPELRLYVTRREKDGRRAVLVGFTLDGLHPVVQRQLELEVSERAVEPLFTIPFLGVREQTEITETVAPDPEEPTEGAVPCTRTRKLALEEELMEATTGKDDIESSFAYYLDVATEAAERADRLGEEMIRAGLAFDERSEIAREKLEDLCGGVVNIERVRDLAASQGKELAELLSDQEYVPGSNVELNADLTAVRNCIGIGAGNEAVNVAVGTQNLCYWQYEPGWQDAASAPENQVRLPPCVAPLAADAPNSSISPPSDAHSCPVRLTNCDQATFGLSEDSPFHVKTTDGTLNVSTGLEIPSSIGNTNEMLLDAQHFGCMLKRIPVNGYSRAQLDCTYAGGVDWVTHSLFRNTGERLGVRVEPFFVAVITLDGREWIRLGRPETGFGAADEWPCSPWPNLPREPAPTLDYNFVKHCTNSVLCGLPAAQCTANNQGWLEGQRRLVKAVWLIKALGGASFDNFQHHWWAYASSPGKSYVDALAGEAGMWETLAGMGERPSWVSPLSLVVGELSLDLGSWTDPFSGKFFGRSAGVSEDAQTARFTSGTWYRGNRPEKRNGNKLYFPTWCAPVQSSALDGSPFLCLETGQKGFVAAPAQEAFDPSFGDQDKRGWIARVLAEPSTRADAYGGVEFDKVPQAFFGPPMPQHGFDEPQNIENVQPQEFADVLELVAAANAQAGGRPGCGTGTDVVPTIRGPEDFPRLASMLDCAGQTVEGMVRDMMLVGIPANVAETAATPGGVQNIVPGLRGKMGSAVGGLAGWLESYAGATSAVSRAIRDVALDFEVAGAQLNINDSEQELAELSMYSTISSAAGACGAAVGKAASGGGVWSGAGFSALSICADAAVQMAVAIKSNDAELEKLSEQRRIALIKLAESITNRMDSIDDARRSLGEAHANVMSTLAQVDGIRNEAKREVSKALGLESDEYGRVFPVSAVMRARYNTAKVRYERALWQAQEAAYLARRAFEQRVGRDLREITSDMTLVQAPSKWVDSVCATTGINYERIRKGNTIDEEDPADTEGTSPDDTYAGSDEYDYADAYIGDYVTNLRRVRDSWGTNFPFQDGDDMVVLSLRDDLLGISTTCDVEGWNELLQTAHSLNDFADAEGTFVEAWQATCSSSACVVALDESAGEPLTCYARDPVQGLIPSPDCNAGDQVPDFGDGAYWPRAVTLRATPSGMVPADPEIPTEPPAQGLTHWYRADSCSAEADGTRVSECENRTQTPPGENRTLIVPTPERVTRLATGIGGQPTLQGTAIYTHTATRTMEVDAFTISTVYRVNADQTFYLWRGDRVMPNGEIQEISLRVWGGEEPYAELGWIGHEPDSTSSAAVRVGVRAPAFYPEYPARGAILTVVVDGRPGDPAPGEMRGIRVYINGQLAGVSDVRPTPQQLGGHVLAPISGATGQMAEWLAYDHALSGQDLSSLHGYLGERYGIMPQEPGTWIEGNELSRIAQRGGLSNQSGFVGAPSSLVDRARATAYGEYGAAANPSAPRGLTSFAGEHYALELEGDDYVGVPPPSASLARQQGSSSYATNWSMPTVDFLASVVGSVEGTRWHTVWRNGQTIQLAVNGATGAVRLTTNGVAVESAPAVITEGVPFVVSIRVSTRGINPSGTLGVTDVVVNGAQVLTADGAPALEGTQLGQGWGDSMKGSVAEYRLTLQSAEDADLAALHSELVSKYGIESVDAGPVEGDPLVGDESTSQPPTTSSPLYRQQVEVTPGLYSLSWYQKANQERLQVVSSGENSFIFRGTYTSEDARREVGAKFLHPEWVRHYGELWISRAGPFYVSWVVPEEVDGVAFAAPQLERNSTFLPVPVQSFFSTDADKASPRGVCEDKDGSVFRNTAWRRGYETTCNSDNNENCNKLGEQGLLEKTYFREVSFEIAQEAIDEGKLFARGGFSKGNYNYRHKSVGVNIVGTGVKKCERSAFPSSCYGSNFLQYSVRHEGPFEVRNHQGVMYDAPLFMGRIQQSKALMAERYLSNPMSSADRALIGDFTSGQFWGRPLDGTYTLRVYDADGLDWDAVEDVQIVLDYRFWTRLD